MFTSIDTYSHIFAPIRKYTRRFTPIYTKYLFTHVLTYSHRFVHTHIFTKNHILRNTKRRSLNLIKETNGQKKVNLEVTPNKLAISQINLL